MKHSTAVCRRSIPRSIQYHGCDSALTRAPARVAQTQSHSDSDHVSSVNPWRRAEFVGAGTMLRLLLPLLPPRIAPNARLLSKPLAPPSALLPFTPVGDHTCFPSTQARGAAPHVVAHPQTNVLVCLGLVRACLAHSLLGVIGAHWAASAPTCLAPSSAPLISSSVVTPSPSASAFFSHAVCPPSYTAARRNSIASLWQ